MVAWECLLAGGGSEELVEAGEPRVVADQGDGGCVVFAVSARLSTALADAERSRVRDAAVSWAAQRAEDGEIIDTEIADGILSELATLVRTARRRSQGVYCWVA